MTKTWLVVVNSSRARIFNVLSKKKLQELNDFMHPQSRLHAQDLTSDLPGRTFDSGGEGRHAMEQKVDPKRNEQINFAHQIADHLDSARIKRDYEQLVLISSPSFLGELRSQLSANVERLIISTIDKDLTSLEAQALADYL